MSSPTPSSLEEAIRDAGEGWIIDWFDPPSDAINHLRRTLEEINRLGRQRLGSGSPSLSEATLVSEHGRNPQRSELQADAGKAGTMQATARLACQAATNGGGKRGHH